MRAAAWLGVTLVSCALSLTASGAAQACGGCFHGSQSAGSVVTGHRMALAISSTRTVLWDQVQYAGAPEDFAWVLPVGEGAYIELADPAWFDALEAVTSTRVSSRQVDCFNGSSIQQGSGRGGGSSGCGFGLSASDDASAAAPSDSARSTEKQGGESGVTVLHEGSVGPYETVTLDANDAMSLRDWLDEHGYEIPSDIDPVIDAYVAEGANFIALRLAPDAGVQQMEPVRVVTPGASPILPLRMVAAGTGAITSVVLYVIGEGRYEAASFGNSVLDPTALAWDWVDASSNYSDLRANLLADNRFLTSFAAGDAFTAQIQTPTGAAAQYQVGFNSYSTLADAYFGQANADAGSATQVCTSVTAAIAAGGKVVEECPAGGCAEGEILASELTCGGDDVAAALIGMRAEDAWVTRLEASLDRDAFQGDLVLEATDLQSPVNNWHVAQKDTQEPCEALGFDGPPQSSTAPAASPQQGDDDEGCGCSLRPVVPNVMASASGLLGLLLVARRFARRRRR